MSLYADGSDWTDEETTKPEFYGWAEPACEPWPADADAELAALVDELTGAAPSEGI
jgi:hypothetical protein